MPRCRTCKCNTDFSTQQLIAHQNKYKGRGGCSSQFGAREPDAPIRGPIGDRGGAYPFPHDDDDEARDDSEQEHTVEEPQERIDMAVWSTITALNNGRGASLLDLDSLLSLMKLVAEVGLHALHHRCMMQSRC